MSKLLADGGHVVGADISKTLLNHAKSKFSDIDTMTFVHCDAQNYSFDENYFDKVISRFGVMFFESPLKAFQNIYGSLKTSGSLNFVCWTNMMENEFIIEGMDIITKYTQKVLPEVTNDPGPFAFSEPEYINEVLESAGFKNINVDTAYLLSQRKIAPSKMLNCSWGSVQEQESYQKKIYQANKYQR